MNIPLFLGNRKGDKKEVIPESLSYKIDEFINWYFLNMVKGSYTDTGEYQFPMLMRNFIEKVAVWYELRYPDYEIAKLFYYGETTDKDVDQIMFGDSQSLVTPSWSGFYNFDTFLRALPSEERWYFDDYRYPGIAYYELGTNSAHFHLKEDGTVDQAEGMEVLAKRAGTDLRDTELDGLHIKVAVQYLYNAGVKFKDDSEIIRYIQRDEQKFAMKNKLLDAIMYRIIERGNNRIGARRAMLFAHEFGRSVEIPMKYGVDTSDPGLRLLINEYIKSGGNPDLECYVNYFYRTSDKDKVETKTVRELLSYGFSNDSFYTPEEDELHQKLVDVLSNRVSEEMKRERKL